jgi:hypothetical protein
MPQLLSTNNRMGELRKESEESIDVGGLTESRIRDGGGEGFEDLTEEVRGEVGEDGGDQVEGDGTGEVEGVGEEDSGD